MVPSRSVRIDTSPRRVDVDDRLGEIRNVVEKLMMHVFCDAMCLRHLQRPVDAEPHLGQQSMTHPPSPDLRYCYHSVDRPHDRRDPLDNGRVDSIEQTLADTAHRLVANDHDRPSDHQADHWVRPLCTQGNGHRSYEDQERRDAIGARMDTVGLQCGRSDPSANPDPVLGDHLVTNTAHDGSSHDESQVGDLLGMNQAVNRFVASEYGGHCDQSDDRQTRHVFGLPVSVGETSCRGTPPQTECQPQWNGSQRISCIVKCVAEEGDGTTLHHYQSLYASGQEQDHERECYCPDAIAAGLQGLIE